MAKIALAKQPVDVELTFKSKPSFNLSFSDITRPTGASVNVEKMHVTENPKIPKQVERIVSDELKAVEAAKGLYDLGLDVYKVAVMLHKMRRQAGVVVFREIHPRYILPLGVWVVRETVRAAFRKRGEKFNTKKEALDFIDSRLQAKEGMRLGIHDFEVLSKILKQKRLTDF